MRLIHRGHLAAMCCLREAGRLSRFALLIVLCWVNLPAQAAFPVGKTAAGGDSASDEDIANSLAAMLRAGRAVISANQPRINDPALGAKGLDGAAVRP